MKLRKHFNYRKGEWYCALSLPSGRKAVGRGRTKDQAFAEAYRELYGGYTPLRYLNPAPVKLVR